MDDSSKLELIVDTVVDQLSLVKEVVLVPKPFGIHKTGRIIISKLCHENKIPLELVAKKLNLKYETSVIGLVYIYNNKPHNYSDARLKDRYNKCKLALTIN